MDGNTLLVVFLILQMVVFLFGGGGFVLYFSILMRRAATIVCPKCGGRTATPATRRCWPKVGHFDYNGPRSIGKEPFCHGSRR